jgi:hypothetical protein
MMNKYLSPYKEYQDDRGNIFYCRRTLKGAQRGTIDCYYENEINRYCSRRIIDNCFSSVEHAKEATDEDLKYSGYIFLTQEQFDKLKVLL